ncbi:MAG: hypothetical protein ABIQ27_05895 [Flavobacterium sp.]|uniref:hypothetical protein n=1 Tax=Flavobacterium sp. TaxID=239 RepID=UPI0032679966
MKNSLLVLSLFLSFLLHAQEESSKTVVPTLEVEKAFQKDFPKIKPSWREEYTGDDKDELSFDADFTLNNTNMTAVYSFIGVFKVLEFEIKTADIPAKISSYMERNYPKNKIKKAAKVMRNNNNITFEIGITINEKWVDVVFNKECDFLKMVQKDE